MPQMICLRGDILNFNELASSLADHPFVAVLVVARVVLEQMLFVGTIKCPSVGDR